MSLDLLRPPLSSRDGEKCEQGPADIVVVKLVSPPLSPLHLLFVSAVVNVVASVGCKAAHRKLSLIKPALLMNRNILNRLLVSTTCHLLTLLSVVCFRTGV